MLTLILVLFVADSTHLRPSVRRVGVTVTPDGSWDAERTPNTNAYQVVFRVTNLQNATITYTLTRSSSSNVTTTSQSQDQVTLAKNAFQDVTVFYNVGAAGPGWVQLLAEGTVGLDHGTWNIPVGHTITVTPDGQTASARLTQTGPYAEVFTLTNNGGNVYTYDLSCIPTANISCIGVGRSRVSLSPGGQASIPASYNVGAAGTGTLRVAATSGTVTDTGSYAVPVNNPPPGAPIIDATPMYGHFSQDMARCAASCFAAAYAQSTVPYFSLDTPHSATLVYHGDRVNPKPFVLVNVRPDSTVGQFPTEYRLQIKVNGSFIRLVNGEGLSGNPVRFSYPGNIWARLGGQLDTSFATGVYSMDIAVAAYYSPSGVVDTNTWTTKLVVVNETNSAVATGWTVAGVQRLYAQGDGSALVTEGQGSAFYFAKVGTAFATPPGDFSLLTSGQPGGGSGWTRTYPDSTKIVFNSSGYMIQARDRFNVIDSVQYDGSNRVSQLKDPLNNTITLTYDANGLTGIQDPFSRFTDIVVDASRRFTTITDPDGFSTTFGYDASQRLKFITDRAGQADTLNYLVINSKETNKLASVKAPPIPVYGGSIASPITTLELWQVKGVAYAATNVTAGIIPSADTVYARTTEPLGAAYTTRFTVNPWGSPLQTMDADSQLTTVTYTLAGLTATGQQPGFGSLRDTSLYNGSGLLTYQRRAGDSATTILYGGWAQPTSVATPGRPTITYALGSLGVVNSVSWGGTSRLTYLYDSYGRTTKVTDALGTIIERLGYPTTGSIRNLTQDTLPGQRVTAYAYDTYGRQTTVTPPSGPQRVTHYNALNWVDSTRVLTSPVTRVKFARDRLGRDTLVTDPMNQTYKYTYNPLGWLIMQADPVSARDTFFYNVGGELVRSKGRLNDSLDFTYDVLHRLRTRVGSLTSSWKYARNSLVVTDSQPGVTTVTSYSNVLGARDSVKTVINGLSYWQRFGYSVGRLDSTYFTGSQDASHLTRRIYRYNASTGALDSIRLATETTKLLYDANLHPITDDFPGSIVTNQSVGSLATLETTTEAANNSNLERWLGFNSLGQIDRHLFYTAKTGRWFAYDSLGQLRAARTRHQTPEGSLPPGCPNFDYGMSGSCTPNVDYVTFDSIGYAYDAAGNRTDQGGAYNTGNRITSFGSCTYKTDAAGNVVSRRGSSPCVQIDTLLWTREGWLDSIQIGSTGIRFLYDVDGRLTAKRINGTTASRFLWNGSVLSAELNGTGDSVVVEYSYYGIDSPHAIIKQPVGTRLYARTDGLLNVQSLTDTSGSIRTSYRYDDWGKLISSSDAEGFSGRDRIRWKGALSLGPEMDLYYMRSRWYEPVSGRFFSEDPVGLSAGLNPLVFAGNDPVNGADPAGLQVVSVSLPGDPWWWGIHEADELWATQILYYPAYWDYFPKNDRRGRRSGDVQSAPTPLFSSEHHAVENSLKCMTSGAQRRVGDLLEQGNIMGYSNPFYSVTGGQESGFVDLTRPTVVQIRRNHYQVGNIFYTVELPWVLMHESEHIVQFAGLNSSEATTMWRQHRDVYQRAADAYANVNYVPGPTCPALSTFSY